MTPNEWWQGGVIYQVYPRSWRDTDGDGVGDLRGVIGKLDYLEWLGVDAVWLNPITPSPDVDWGYDVSDYTAVHPALGTLDTLDELIEKTAARAIAIVLDIVPSHTSDQHPWFLGSRASRDSRYRDYYVWRPPGPNGARPNNWIGYFGEPAWSLDESTGEYYLHNFSPHQPQLNWWNGDVRAEFDRILQFWFNRGVAGVRMDAVQALLYDPLFRDNPPAAAGDSRKEQEAGQRFRFNANHPSIHEIVRGWRAAVDRFQPARLLFGETWVSSIAEMAQYYGRGDDELHLAWNVPFLETEFAAAPLRHVIKQTFAEIPTNAWPAWAISTHDNAGRAAARWCRGDSACTRCALLMLLTLRGTPIVYYGDEIGMSGLSVQTSSALRDRAQANASRDASRSPMQWRADTGAGFTTSATPWLPIGDASQTNVDAQHTDRGSTLWFVHDLLLLRRTVTALSSGTFELLPSPDALLAWRRDSAMVALNVGGASRQLQARGTIAICTDRARDGERLDGLLELPPLQGVVVLP